MYSVALVLSGKGFTGVSLTTLVAILSDLFIGITLSPYVLSWYLSPFLLAEQKGSLVPLSECANNQSKLSLTFSNFQSCRRVQP